MTVDSVIRELGIRPPSAYANERKYYTTCPQCSKDRRHHGKAKCLVVRIYRDKGMVCWKCFHATCAWEGYRYADQAPDRPYRARNDHVGGARDRYRARDQSWRAKLRPSWA